MKIRGRWSFVLHKQNGLYLRGKGKNLVTTLGLQLVAEVLRTNVTPTTTQFAKYLGFGDGGGAVDLAQTALQGTEHFLPRPAMTASRLGATVSLTVAYLNSGANKTVKEMGLFTASTVGIMFARMVVQDFVFANGDTLDFTWSEEIQ